MAECIVEVCRIDAIEKHPNADALDLAIIKGWQCVVPKGRYSPGELVTYIPIDSVVPAEHSDRWGITKYLSKQRVRCAKLRGEPSFGVVIEREQPWDEGTDVRSHYGIEKYVPPVVFQAGDAEQDHPLFVSYTDIENLRNYPDVLEQGEEVVVTEKIHGTNCRIGAIEGEIMAGSMGLRRKRPEDCSINTYWFPLTIPGVESLITWLAVEHRQAILFGEVFGSRVQSLHYGHKGTLGFRAFDLLVDGKYLDADEFLELCSQHSVPTVPILWRGDYSLDQIKLLSAGSTTLADSHIREGVVVRPAIERRHPKIRRVCLKYISDAYLLDGGISDSRDA